MLMPKKVKFRKQQRGRMRGKAWRGSDLSFGDFGLKVQECGYITDRQIEASRIAMTRFIKRGGKVWLRMFPTSRSPRSPPKRVWARARVLPTTGSRWFAPARSCSRWRASTPELAKEAMRLAAHKLPLKTMFVQRHT